MIAGLPASLRIGPGIKGLACRRGQGKFRRNVRLGSPLHPRGEKPASPSSFGKDLLEETEADSHLFYHMVLAPAVGSFRQRCLNIFQIQSWSSWGDTVPWGPRNHLRIPWAKQQNTQICIIVFFNSAYKQYRIFFFLCLTYLLAQCLFSFVVSRTSYKWKYSV